MKALQGDLSEFPLTDIIQLVALSKKTGAVEFEGQRGTARRFRGRIFFRDGNIVAAEMPGFSPLEAVYTSFTLSSGPFHFLDNVQPTQETISISNEIIIMEGIMRRDAWESNPVEESPELSLSMIPRLVPNPAPGTTDIHLEAEEWRVLTMVNGQNTVGQIAQRSGLGEVRTREIIAALLKSGLIEEETEAAK